MRPMRWGVLVFTSLLTALPGCDRDFELPPPKDDKPEFLGELAGTYTFSVASLDQVAGRLVAVPMPVSGVIQHLPGMKDQPDVVVGFFFDRLLDDVAVETDVCSTADAILPVTLFSTRYEKGEGTGSVLYASDDQPLEITRLAGGRTLSLTFAAC